MVLVITAFGLAVGGRPPPDAPEGQTASAGDSSEVQDQRVTNPGLAIGLPGGVALHDAVNGVATTTAREGLIFPIVNSQPGWHQVITTCGREAWVAGDSVQLTQQAVPATAGERFDLSRAVVVVDAGHGGRDLGAKGANGTWEAHVNLEIVELLRARLESANDIDWATGSVTPGSDYPAVQQVWLTRTALGPNGGDVELSLAYRAEMANRSGADALLSVHNNTAPEVTSTTPGTDVFYSVGSPGSDRLASLIHEEMVRSLASLGDEWSSGKVTGPKTRVDPDSGDDFYGILRRSEPPAVIIEGLYISDADEEAILNTTLGKQTYADAVYRGLVRYLTTDAIGSEIHDPEPFSSDVGSASYDSCVVPSQPGS